MKCNTVGCNNNAIVNPPSVLFEGFCSSCCLSRICYCNTPEYTESDVLELIQLIRIAIDGYNNNTPYQHLNRRIKRLVKLKDKYKPTLKIEVEETYISTILEYKQARVNYSGQSKR